MRLLVDAHGVIWSVDQPQALSKDARAALSDPGNVILLSAATIGEIAIKCGLGKLTLSQPFRPWIDQAIRDLSVIILPINVESADASASLPHHHRDPFDRMLVAQARVEAIPLVSRDPVFDQYAVQRIW